MTEIPKGFKTLLPEEAERLKKVISTMEEVVSKWGYCPLELSLMEFLGTFKLVDEDFEEFSFKTIDRTTGKLLAVRPDFTPQVARVVASVFKGESPPLRFYYCGKVYRDLNEEREIFQFGFELIGAPESEADAEVVAVLVDIFETLGLKSFQIDIGHSEFVEGAIEEIGVKDRETFRNLLLHKDFSGIEEFLARESVSREKREKAETLLELYGGREVLERAVEVFENERSVRAIERLKEVYEILASYGFESRVIFDLSERRGLKYHSGITYEVFHPLFSSSLAFGGRYDKLLGLFGKDMPATGIAVRVDSLVEVLVRKGVFEDSKKDIYIVDLEKKKGLAYNLAKKLREKGFVVARDIVKREENLSVLVAKKKGYRHVVVLNRKNPPRHILISGERRIVLEEDNLFESVIKALKEVEVESGSGH